MKTDRESVKRRARFVFVLMLFCGGIIYFHYMDMVKPVPEFATLVSKSCSGLKYGINRGSVQFSFEFFDDRKLRYQTGYVDRAVANKIKSHLESGEVTMYYGPWDTALRSSKIFSIYHLAAGDDVLIEHSDLVESKIREKKGALPVAIIGAATFMAVVVFSVIYHLNRLPNQ